MQDLLVFILKNLVTLPDAVQVTTEIQDDVTNYLITVSPEDVGRVIGKEGKVIKAIRTVLRTVAIQQGARIRVTVVSEQEGSVPSSTAPSDDTVTVDDDSISIEV